MHLIFSRFVFEFVYFSNCNSTDYCRKLTQILALHPVKNISLYYYYFFTNILHFFHVIKWVPGFHTCSFSCLLMSCIFFLILSNYFFFNPIYLCEFCLFTIFFAADCFTYFPRFEKWRRREIEKKTLTYTTDIHKLYEFH